MKKKITYALSLLPFILILSSCAISNTIVTDYDADADFSSYKTFYWSDEFQQSQHPEVENPMFYNTLNKKRLKRAITDEMKGRGYIIDESNPDLLVNARIVVEERNRTTFSQNRYPYYYGWYSPNTNTTTTSKKEGSVVIEFIDKEEKQLVWQGYAPEVLQLSTKDKSAQIRAAISEIFARYEHRADS